MKTQFVMDSKGRKTAVLLPVKEYQKILGCLKIMRTSKPAMNRESVKRLVYLI